MTEEMVAQCVQMMAQMQGMMGNGMMGPGMMGGMMSGGMMSGGTYWLASPWYWLGWALVVAVVLWLIIAIPRALRRPSVSAETPQQILKRRYARGDISSEQFETMKAQLDS
jgi:putative membrane protein